MFKKICATGATLAVAGGALMVSGCGSSAPSSSTQGAAASAPAPHTTTLPSGQALVEAADHTDQISGYRFAASMKITVDGTPVPVSMSGVIGDHGKVAALTTHESVEGHTLNLQVRMGNGKDYMTGVPGLSQIAHGKHWLSFDLAAAQKAEGLSGLQNPTSSNPAEFLKYLRTVGSSVTPVGTSTVDGVSATEYRATIDLDRYTKLLPAAQRPTATRTIATLEKAIGGDTVPVTVWVDSQHQVRRMQMNLAECVAGQHARLSMTLNLSDYGKVPAVSIPSDSDAYDITPMLTGNVPNLQSQAGGCSAS